MKFTRIAIIIGFILALAQPMYAQPQVIQSDFDALIAIYNATGGPNWNDNSGWNTSAPVSQWAGVEVSGNRVVALRMPNNNLVGDLPPELNDLTGLVRLELSINKITSVPPINSLVNLDRIFFSTNSLTSFPEIDSLENLQFLYLLQNDLTTIPEVENLTLLRSLLLQDNEIETLPPLPNSIEILNLSNNRLTNLPDLSGLTDLNVLYLFNNRLTFTDIIPLTSNVPDSIFIYAPQDSVDYTEFISYQEGDSLTFLPGEDVSQTPGQQQVQFVWFTEDPAGNFFDSVNTVAFNTGILSDSQNGQSYYYKSRFSDLPELTLVSRKRTIVFNPEINEIYPVPFEVINEERRIILEYEDNWTENDRLRADSILKSFGVVKLDSCLCGFLEVWELPDTLQDDAELLRLIDPEKSKRHVIDNVGAEEGNGSVNITWDFPLEDKPIPLSGENWKVKLVGSLPQILNPVTIAVIDLGIDTTHKRFEGNVFKDESWQTDSKGADGCIDFPDDLHGYDFYGNDAFTDVDGHGTHIGGILPDFLEGIPLQIMSLRVGETTNSARVFEVVCALEYAIRHQVDVINLSMGYYGFGSKNLEEMIHKADSLGIPIVTSAGNSNLDNDDPANLKHWPSSYYPDYDNVFSVASLSLNGAGDYEKSSFSNFGPQSVYVGAPGENIYSALPNGGAGFKSGTSMAAAFMTGIIGYLKSITPILSITGLRQGVGENVNSIEEPNLLSFIIEGRRLNVLYQNCAEYPFAENDSIKLENETVTFDVMGNDCWAPTMSPTQIDNPKHGTLTFNSTTNEFTYKPDNTYSGIDSFKYELTPIVGNEPPSQATVYLKGMPEEPMPWWCWFLIGLGGILLIFLIRAISRAIQQSSSTGSNP